MRFDEELALWQALEAIGAGSFGPGGEPLSHVSLAVYDDEDAVDETAARRRSTG